MQIHFFDEIDHNAAASLKEAVLGGYTQCPNRIRSQRR